MSDKPYTTAMYWQVTYLVRQVIRTEIKSGPDETPEDVENRHLAAQTVKVCEASREIMAHLAELGIAEDDVRIALVTTEDGTQFA